MDMFSDFRRRRTMRKVQTAAGVRAGKGGRRPGGRLIAHHKEPADIHMLLAEDAQPNLRVWQMWDEACDFEDELGHFRSNLAQFEAATDEFLTRLEPILRAPLPRVWDAVEGGLAEPTRATISHGHSHTVGGDASTAGLEEARSELHNRLRGHVARPLHQWSEALGVVEERLPELNRLRSQVIKHSRSAARSSRHYRQAAGTSVSPAAGGGEVTERAIVPHRGGGGGGFGGMFGACARPPRTGHRGRGGYHDDEDTSSSDDDDDRVRETGVDRETRRERAVEEAGLRVNYRHRQLLAARADYADAERLLSDQLSGLQRDAAWTKSYVVSALLLTKEAMQTAVVSLGNTKQPLPGFTTRSSLPPARHGELCDNFNLAADMPSDLDLARFEGQLGGSGGPGIAAGTPPALPPTEVHAHRATAQPMELHARPDVAALDRVATPPTGAGAIPMSMLPDRYHPGPPAEGGSLTSGLAGEGARGRVGPYRPVLGGRRDAGSVAAPAADSYYASSSARGGPRISEASSTTSSRAGTGAAALEGGSLELRPGASSQWQQDVTPSYIGQAAGGRSLTSAAGAGPFSSQGAAVGSGGGGGSTISPGSGAAGSGVVGVGVGASRASVLRADDAEFVCSRQEFSQIEDRPVTRERVTTIVEHRPVEKQYVTEVRYVGEESLGTSSQTVGPATTRVVAVAEPGPKCPTGVNTSAALRAVNGAADVAAPPAVRADNTEYVCDTKEFTQVEDRPVTRERVETIMEHRPVEKEYVAEVRYVGETPLPGSSEVLEPAADRVVGRQPGGPPTGIREEGAGIMGLAAGGPAGGPAPGGAAAAGGGIKGVVAARDSADMAGGMAPAGASDVGVLRDQDRRRAGFIDTL